MNNATPIEKHGDIEPDECVEFIVEADLEGERIDKYLTIKTELTRSAVTKLIDDGNVTVQGKTIAKNYKVKRLDTVEVILPPVLDVETVPQNIPVEIIYEDSDIIVVNKPSGMVVHPAAGNIDGTLVNALLYHCGGSLSGIGGVARPGIVHRIDKDTSGLLVVAKNDKAHLSLTGQLKDHSVSRVYFAIVCGGLKNDEGTVDAPIGRNPNDRKKMAVIRDPSSGRTAKNAITHYTVLERFKGYSFIRCKLETGRTHQIRVHMASIGHPILGDPVYGGENTKFFQSNKALIHGQCLHAGELHLTHPTTKEQMKFSCEMPEDTKKLLEKLRQMQKN